MANFFNVTYLATCPWPLTYDPRLANTTVPCNIICPLPMYGPDKDGIAKDLRFAVNLVALILSSVMLISQIILLIKRKKLGGDIVTTVLLLEFFVLILIAHLLTCVQFRNNFACAHKYQAASGTACWIFAFIRATNSMTGSIVAALLLVHTCYLVFFPKYLPTTTKLLFIYHFFTLGYVVVTMSIISTQKGIYGGQSDNCGFIPDSEGDWWRFFASYVLPAFINASVIVAMAVAGAIKIVYLSGFDGLIRARRILLLVSYFSATILLVESILFWQIHRRKEFTPRYTSWVLCAAFQKTIEEKYDNCKVPLGVPYGLTIFYTIFVGSIGTVLFMIFFDREIVSTWRDLFRWFVGIVGLAERISMFSTSSSSDRHSNNSGEIMSREMNNIQANSATDLLESDKRQDDNKSEKTQKSARLTSRSSQRVKNDVDEIDSSSSSESSARDRRKPIESPKATSPKRADSSSSKSSSKSSRSAPQYSAESSSASSSSSSASSASESSRQARATQRRDSSSSKSSSKSSRSAPQYSAESSSASSSASSSESKSSQTESSNSSWSS